MSMRMRTCARDACMHESACAHLCDISHAAWVRHKSEKMRFFYALLESASNALRPYLAANALESKLSGTETSGRTEGGTSAFA